MFSVFNANLLTDMGKTIARKHLNTTDVQEVWQELSDHMWQRTHHPFLWTD